MTTRSDERIRRAYRKNHPLPGAGCGWVVFFVLVGIGITLVIVTNF